MGGWNGAQSSRGGRRAPFALLPRRCRRGEERKLTSWRGFLHALLLSVEFNLLVPPVNVQDYSQVDLKTLLTHPGCTWKELFVGLMILGIDKHTLHTLQTEHKTKVGLSWHSCSCVHTRLSSDIERNRTPSKFSFTLTANAPFELSAERSVPQRQNLAGAFQKWLSGCCKVSGRFLPRHHAPYHASHFCF